MRKKSMYALYKGDDFVDMGSLDYLAKLIGVKRNTIEFYRSPAHKKKVEEIGSDGYIVIKVDDIDEEGN